MLSSSSASTMHSREGLPPPKRNRSTRLSSALCTPPSARRDWKGKEIGIIGPLPTYRSGGSAQVIRTSQRAFRAKKHGPQCKDSLTFRTKTRVPRASQDVLLKCTCPPIHLEQTPTQLGAPEDVPGRLALFQGKAVGPNKQESDSEPC
jgi:hypothetical protein